MFSLCLSIFSPTTTPAWLETTFSGEPLSPLNAFSLWSSLFSSPMLWPNIANLWSGVETTGGNGTLFSEILHLNKRFFQEVKGGKTFLFSARRSQGWVNGGCVPAFFAPIPLLTLTPNTRQLFLFFRQWNESHLYLRSGFTWHVRVCHCPR